MRNIKYKNGFWYHVFNRGVDGRDIFCDENDYRRFLLSMVKFNNLEPIGGLFRGDKCVKPGKEIENNSYCINVEDVLVDVACYCLNKNHYHFVLRQKIDDGISKFMQKIGMGYTHFFNIKYARSGSLLQGAYKSVYIKSTEQLLYLSAYVNGNAEIHGISQADEWAWSSYGDYLGGGNSKYIKKNIILDEFESINGYRKYFEATVKEAKRRKKELREFLLE
jgi:putative transposase